MKIFPQSINLAMPKMMIFLQGDYHLYEFRNRKLISRFSLY